jgi:hypothetical protein
MEATPSQGRQTGLGSPVALADSSRVQQPREPYGVGDHLIASGEVNGRILVGAPVSGSPGSRNRIASYLCPWHDAGP